MSNRRCAGFSTIEVLATMASVAVLAGATVPNLLAALDRYRFIRDGFLQRRRSLVYDGSPPPDKDDVDKPSSSPASPPPDDPNVKKDLVPPQTNTPPAPK